MSTVEVCLSLTDIDRIKAKARAEAFIEAADYLPIPNDPYFIKSEEWMRQRATEELRGAK